MKLKLITGIVLCAFTSFAHANDAMDWINEQGQGLVSVSGFGTLAATKTNTQNAEFITSPKQVGGATNSSWDATLDTDLGLQVKLKPTATSPFSFTMQGLAKKREHNDFRMRTEWAYAQYDTTPDISIRAGKLAVPIFTLSDIRNVGYAQLSVRPSLDLYGLVPVTQYTGGEMIYRLGSSVGNFVFQPFIGQHRDYVPEEGGKIEFKGRKLVGMNASWEKNGLMLRAVHLKTKMTDNNNTGENQLFDLMNMLGETELVNHYALNDKQVYFSGIGVNYENKHMTFQSEYARRNAKASWLGVMDGWYVLGGYKLNSMLTPYVGLSGATPKSSIDTNDIQPYSPYHVMAQQGINSLLKSAAVDQRTSTVGMRYDFHDNMAVKVQIDRTHVKSGAEGYFKQAQPNFNNNNAYYNMYNISLDYVF